MDIVTTVPAALAVGAAAGESEGCNAVEPERPYQYGGRNIRSWNSWTLLSESSVQPARGKMFVGAAPGASPIKRTDDAAAGSVAVSVAVVTVEAMRNAADQVIRSG